MQARAQRGPKGLPNTVWNYGVRIVQSDPQIPAAKLAERLGIGETKAREIKNNPVIREEAA